LFLLLAQHTSLSPDGKLVVIVGDDTDALLIDAYSGKVIVLLQSRLKGQNICHCIVSKLMCLVSGSRLSIP
jgi:hypothetical protein